MATSNIPLRIRNLLWAKAAGRCQYSGCNKPLWEDMLTKRGFNSAYIAHIIADSPGGPRGCRELSNKKSKEISNLMLLCDSHHRLIDKVDIAGHPVKLLKKMKQEHEQRIELLTSLQDEKKSHVIMYGANIDSNVSPLRLQKVLSAMWPENYPAESIKIELSLSNSAFEDSENEFWRIERENLRRQFIQKIRPRLESDEINHFSVFAIAPQPLLIELGRHFSDIQAVSVFQLHREPQDWVWQSHPKNFKFIVKKPRTKKKNVALNLSLSATINNSRIFRVLGNNTSIWTLSIDEPSNDFLKSRKQLSMFREKIRLLLDNIKATHGHDTVLHIFPAIPVSIAVEIGRVWMPKADLALRIYDENRKTGGFNVAFDIKQA